MSEEDEPCPIVAPIHVGQIEDPRITEARAKAFRQIYGTFAALGIVVAVIFFMVVRVSVVQG